MRTFVSALVFLFLASALPGAQAQTVTPEARARTSDVRARDSDVRARDGDARARAVASCNANRGTDCKTDAGLKEWIEAESPRPPGQRSAIMEQKLEAERRAQQQADTKAAPR